MWKRKGKLFFQPNANMSLASIPPYCPARSVEARKSPSPSKASFVALVATNAAPASYPKAYLTPLPPRRPPRKVPGRNSSFSLGPGTHERQVLLDASCVLCHGDGNISGIAGYDEKGEVVEGFFPCERCNGAGTEVVWYQDCPVCLTTGFIESGYGEENCSRCLGRGFLLPEAPSKKDRWEIING